jgi:hypothetical protein
MTSVDIESVKELATRPNAPLAIPMRMSKPPAGGLRPGGEVERLRRYFVECVGEDQANRAMACLLAHPDVEVTDVIRIPDFLLSLITLGRSPRSSSRRERYVRIPTSWFLELGRDVPSRRNIPLENHGS